MQALFDLFIKEKLLNRTLDQRVGGSSPPRLTIKIYDLRQVDRPCRFSFVTNL